MSAVLTVHEAAIKLSLSVQAVLDAVERGDLPAAQPGDVDSLRFRAEDVEAFLQSGRAEPAGDGRRNTHAR